MLNIFKKKEYKDPVCGMVVDKKAISKYGEKFCAEACVKSYEKQHNIDPKAEPHSCCN